MVLKKLLAVSFTLLSLEAVASAHTFSGVENTAEGMLKTQQYWNSERLKNAKELPIPQINSKDTQATSSEVSENADSDGVDGVPPQISTEAETTPLFTPNEEQQIAQRNIDYFRGTSLANFSSSQLIPLSADQSYPYRAVGKLFFTIPNSGDFVCSASVINQRVLVTAGHCVHSGTGGNAGYYTNFLFIPAYRDGTAPYKSWGWSYVEATPTWMAGKGIVPNAADYAMLELTDVAVDNVVQKIGAVTGVLGYQLNSLVPNHAHLLGYPCNLDSCQKMHQVTAQSAKTVAPNNAEYGSDMQGGSSGGPWIQNFGVPSAGQNGAQNAGMNRIIGITSYGYDNTAVMLQGSSILDARFTTLLNKLCAHKAGNCA